MAEFKSRGTAVIKEMAERKGKRRFTPNIFWAKSGDVRYIAWLTDADDVIKVRLHEFVRVPDDSRESGFRWETFLCRKDEALVESSGGYCTLCDDLKHEAKERFVGLAIELEPDLDGKRITGLNVMINKFKNKDGEDREAPRWGLITQGSKNFFAYFAAFFERRGTIKGFGWEIQRDGDGLGTKYNPMKIDEVPLPDLTPFLEDVPKLEDILEGMGSDEKYKELEGVEPDSQESAAPTEEAQSEFDRLKAEIEGAKASE
jgi:hypothetical protein